jgi:hypothetical protein
MNEINTRFDARNSAHTGRCQVVLHLGLIHSSHTLPFSMKQDSDDQLTDLDDLQGSQDPAAVQDRIIRRRSSKGALSPVYGKSSR